MLLAMVVEVVEKVPEKFVMNPWIGIAGILAFFLVAILITWIGGLKNQPEVTAWTEGPVCSQPVMIRLGNRKYICLPAEESGNSWEQVVDILEAAKRLREEREAKQPKMAL